MIKAGPVKDTRVFLSLSLFILLTGVSSPLQPFFPLLINDPTQLSLLVELVFGKGFLAQHIVHAVRDKSLHTQALN